jgi:LuxR family maltose regulon positive regulatory protein
VLTYLLGNAPTNLHIALAARPTSALMASGALSVAPVTRVMGSDLRFRVDETHTVLGAQRSPEMGVRLHELTEGWPLGVQLAVTALQRSGDLEGLLGAATADIRRYFVDTAIDRQSAEATHLLVRLAHFDLIHP